MTKYDCDVCRGSGYVNLAVAQPLTAKLDKNSSTTAVSSHRIYPCPECNNNSPLRVEHIQFRHMMPTSADSKNWPPGYLQQWEEAGRREAAARLADMLMKKWDTFMERKVRFDGYTQMDEIKYDFYVLSKEAVAPTIKQQVESKLHTDLEAARMVIKEKIYGWNTSGDWLYKAQACSAVDEALKEVIGE